MNMQRHCYGSSDDVDVLSKVRIKYLHKNVLGFPAMLRENESAKLLICRRNTI